MVMTELSLPQQTVIIVAVVTNIKSSGVVSDRLPPEVTQVDVGPQSHKGQGTFSTSAGSC